MLPHWCVSLCSKLNPTSPLTPISYLLCITIAHPKTIKKKRVSERKLKLWLLFTSTQLDKLKWVWITGDFFRYPTILLWKGQTGISLPVPLQRWNRWHVSDLSSTFRKWQSVMSFSCVHQVYTKVQVWWSELLVPRLFFIIHTKFFLF